MEVPYLDLESNDYGNWVVMEGVGRPISASPAINRLMTATSSSISILPFDAPYPNSSYTLNFSGPAIKCENLSTATLNTAIDLGEANSLQDAWDQIMNDKISGNPDPIWTPFLYTAATENGSVTILNNFFINIGGPYGQNYSCHLWNTSFTVLFQFNDGIQSISDLTLNYVAPKSVPGGDVDVSYAPGDIAYFSIFNALSNLVVAQLRVDVTDTFYYGNSNIVSTGIVACPDFLHTSSGLWPLARTVSPWMCRSGSVVGAIEDLSQNLTLSLLSSGLFANKTTAEVMVTVSQIYYTYNWYNLVVSYLAAVMVALVCVAVGIHAYLANGYSASSSFSSIMFTTRNADLDRLAGGQCLGAQPIPRELGDVKLQYGLLRSETVPAHAAFGLRGTVTKLGKGDLCF